MTMQTESAALSFVYGDFRITEAYNRGMGCYDDCGFEVHDAATGERLGRVTLDIAESIRIEAHEVADELMWRVPAMIASCFAFAQAELGGDPAL